MCNVFFFQFWTQFHGEKNPEFQQLFPIMNNLQEQFQRSVPNFDVQEASVGDMCVARFKKDSAWYRAIVIGQHLERQTVDVFRIVFLYSRLFSKIICCGIAKNMQKNFAP